MRLKEAYQKLLKRGKTITDGNCRITLKNKNILVIERIYKFEKLDLRRIKRFMSNYVYDSSWEWEEEQGILCWEIIKEEDNE
jgi:hypothetical protein